MKIMTPFYRVTTVVMAASFLTLFSPSSYAEQPSAPPQIDAKAFILMDATSGRVLAELNADERLDPASLTKIMTSYVVGQAIKAGKIKPDDRVTVGSDAWANGNPSLRGSSLMFLKPGDQILVSDLNKGMVIQSGNDASIALADYVAGSQQAFISLMNQYAASLGLSNSHFLTVHGLDTPGQYSTARDMSRLTQALIRDLPDEYALHSEKAFTFNKINQPNRNRLLWSATLRVDGVKTGFTHGAGYNLVSSAVEGGTRLIAVVLGSSSDAIRFRESEKLLAWGFRFFETVTVVRTDEPFTTQRVWFGVENRVRLGVTQDAAVTVPKGQVKNVKANFTLNARPLQAPLKQGQVVGSLDFTLDGVVVGQRPLVVMDEVPEAGLLGRLWDAILMKLSGWFGGLFS
ncbi:serine hydrolase [Musicola paradisiaca]|uniref:serine-type D-Ala-D-Ala carboxypeptidase n=1 Tax=Musicola paradisiaca (strain Ech703) TaxID=579405 RepID=C6C8B3_MUSP7|nr:serine hydrolase [Musicola paradisiaca]ACS86079.1 Beta-lactamase [Musicola paradisiaca Ech703]